MKQALEEAESLMVLVRYAEILIFVTWISDYREDNWQQIHITNTTNASLKKYKLKQNIKLPDHNLAGHLHCHLLIDKENWSHAAAQEIGRWCIPLWL